MINHYISATVCPIFTSTCYMTCFCALCKDVPFGGCLILQFILSAKCPQNPINRAEIGIFKPNMQKNSNFHTMKTNAAIQTKFCTMMKISKYCLWVVPQSILQIQDGGRPPSWKKEKLQYLCNGLTDFGEIWHDDASRTDITWPDTVPTSGLLFYNTH